MFVTKPFSARYIEFRPTQINSGGNDACVRFELYGCAYGMNQQFYLKLSWIGGVSSKCENQIYKTIISCFYALKPRVIYNARVILPSAKKIAYLPLNKLRGL